MPILEPPFTDYSSEASEDKRKRRLAEDDRRQVNILSKLSVR